MYVNIHLIGSLHAYSLPFQQSILVTAGIGTSHLFKSLMDTLACFTGTFLTKTIDIFEKQSNLYIATTTVVRKEVREQVITFESLRVTYTR